VTSYHTVDYRENLLQQDDSLDFIKAEARPSDSVWDGAEKRSNKDN
jgi:hypothetical protein